ncbi:MAG TPA: hypothetical protein VF262_12435 [Burkholderiales bacterium]
MSASTANRNVFSRVLEGELGLAITYWGIGVGGSLALFLPLGFLYTQAASPWLQRGIVIVAVAFGVLAGIAVWNAATRYAGRKLWSILAKIAVVLGALNLVASIATVAGSLFDPLQAQLDQTAFVLSLDTPRMMGPATRLNKVTSGKKSLVYSYTLTQRKASELSIPAFQREARPLLIKGICENADVKALLERDVSVVFSYLGSDELPIADFTLDKTDCAR